MIEKDIEILKSAYDFLAGILPKSDSFMPEFKDIIEANSDKKMTLDLSIGEITTMPKMKTHTIKLDGNIIEELETAINENEEIKFEISSKSFKFERNCAIENITQNKVNDINISNTETTIELVEIQKIEMPKTKRYRLEIQYPIDKEWVGHAHVIMNYDGQEVKVVHEDDEYFLLDFPDSRQKAKKEWLVEIEEEKPLTAEEWLPTYCSTATDPTSTLYGENDMKQAYDKGSENNELKHQETKSFVDIISYKYGNGGPNREDYNIHDMLNIWESAFKSRGYE